MPSNELHGSWKGDNVGYFGLHVWMRKNFPKPELCQNCNLVPPTELANVTGVYSRDFTNWKYMCHKCHFRFDRLIDMTNRKCSACGKNKTLIQKGRPHWLYVNDQLVCRNCYKKHRYSLAKQASFPILKDNHIC